MASAPLRRAPLAVSGRDNWTGQTPSAISLQAALCRQTEKLVLICCDSMWGTERMALLHSKSSRPSGTEPLWVPALVRCDARCISIELPFQSVSFGWKNAWPLKNHSFSPGVGDVLPTPLFSYPRPGLCQRQHHAALAEFQVIP